MNEVKKCSISGVAFTLDNDAYEALERYIESLRQAYKNSPDGVEIIADIEARIAELILSAQDGGRVVEKPLVLNIIQQLGSAQDISEKDENPDADLQSESPRIPRRLYRDIENAKLGGVCAGLGRYFGIDAVWIRLGIFLPILLEIILGSHFWFVGNVFGNIFGVFLLCYLIMWFAVPVARSARQKLEMNGDPITTQSVADATAAAANDVDSKAKSVVAETVSVFGKVVLILLKIFAGLLVFGLICTACALIVGLICVAVGEYGFLHFSPDEYWLPITGILVVLVPVFLLIYVLMCLLASRKPGGKTILATFLFWIVTIIACVVFAIRADVTDEVRHVIRNNTNRIETPRPDMEELEQQLEALESYSIDIRDSTNKVNITVRANRKASNEGAANRQTVVEQTPTDTLR